MHARERMGANTRTRGQVSTLARAGKSIGQGREASESIGKRFLVYLLYKQVGINLRNG